jgi:hypothetical protein
MDYKVLLLEALGLPAEATDDDITAALAAAKDQTLASQADKAALAEKDKEVAALASRAATAETALAGLRADATLAKLAADGYLLASRDDARAALLVDHDRTLAAIRAFRPAPKAAEEPLRSRADARAPTPATADAREAAIAAETQKHNFKRRADAIASAMRARPELWKTE